MFILDADVLSELMRSEPAPAVTAWISGQPAKLLFTTVICQAEILSGIAVLPEGRRRRALEDAARTMFMEDFDSRILPFDSDAALNYADLFAVRRQAGLPTSMADLMVAAIAGAQGGSVVTRDIVGFEGCGLSLINPWKH